MKNNKFFEKKRNFFGLGKILSTQTSNLAICLDIYVGICCLPTKIARVTTGNVCRWLYWNQSSNYNIPVLPRKTAIKTTFYFPAEKEIVCIWTAWTTILTRAFCNTHSDFHMEKTGIFNMLGVRWCVMCIFLFIKF